MTRADRIRAELLARLDVERFTYAPPRGPSWADPITPEQAAENRAILLDALSDDPCVVAWREKEGELMSFALQDCGLSPSSGASVRYDKSGPNRAVSATRPGPDHLPELAERG